MQTFFLLLVIAALFPTFLLLCCIQAGKDRHDS